jgi:serine/threonine protein kinase
MFARKIIRPFGDVKMTDIIKEFTVVRNLCEPGLDKNVVAVLGCGRLPSAPFYFIDMELCELNLGTYISRKWNRELEQSVPFLSEIHSSATREISQMGEVMTDIGSGLEFIHSHEMIHRDLKPQNGTLHLSLS